MRLIAVCPAHLARNLGGREYCSLVLPSHGRKVRNLFPRQRKEKKKTSLNLNRDLAKWDEEQHAEAPLPKSAQHGSSGYLIRPTPFQRGPDERPKSARRRLPKCPAKKQGPFLFSRAPGTIKYWGWGREGSGDSLLSITAQSAGGSSVWPRYTGAPCVCSTYGNASRCHQKLSQKSGQRY